MSPGEVSPGEVSAGALLLGPGRLHWPLQGSRDDPQHRVGTLISVPYLSLRSIPSSINK